MRFLSRRNVSIVLAIIVVVVGAYLFVIQPMSEQKNRTQVMLARHQDFVIATGRVEARDDVTLSFEGGGSVSRVVYQAGDTVSDGSVIASLDADTLQADVEAQRLRVQQASTRLGGLVDGPEDAERMRVEADVAVAEKMMDQEVHLALVSAQKIAGGVEHVVRTEFDTLFGRSGEDFRFKMNIPSTDKQRIGAIREGFEEVFDRWRIWLNNSEFTYHQSIIISKQLESDLRLLHGGLVEIYDFVLPFRTSQAEGENVFLLSSKLRETFVSAIVDVVRHINTVEVSRARYQLAVAQSKEVFAGGTKSDQEAQEAQIDIERKNLRRLELQLAKTEIKAPFDGVVGEIFVTEGEVISAGADAVRFISQKGFSLSVDVTEVEIQDVVLNQEMQAYVEVTGDEIAVRVRTIDATEKRVNDVPVYTVVLDVSEEHPSLRPGMTVDVYIPSGEATDVFSVPRTAITKRDGKDFVLIERGGDSMLIPVVVGASLDDGFVAVTGELFKDDVVVFKDHGNTKK